MFRFSLLERRNFCVKALFFLALRLCLKLRLLPGLVDFAEPPFDIDNSLQQVLFSSASVFGLRSQRLLFLIEFRNFRLALLKGLLLSGDPSFSLLNFFTLIAFLLSKPRDFFVERLHLGPLYLVFGEPAFIFRRNTFELVL